MSSAKFLKIARKILLKDRALFDTLVEFEKTGRIRTRARVNFTVDKSIASNFRKFCRDKGYNMSAKVEQAMKELIEKG